MLRHACLDENVLELVVTCGMTASVCCSLLSLMFYWYAMLFPNARRLVLLVRVLSCLWVSIVNASVPFCFDNFRWMSQWNFFSKMTVWKLGKVYSGMFESFFFFEAKVLHWTKLHKITIAIDSTVFQKKLLWIFWIYVKVNRFVFDKTNFHTHKFLHR